MRTRLSDEQDAWVGKWICFQSDGSIVIAEVLYVRESTMERFILITAIGNIEPKDVLEKR
jgi:hypothetical protein